MISTEFEKNVKDKDLIAVRSALIDYLIIDRTFEKFDKALEYARKNLNIMEPHDNNAFVMESEKWDNTYMNQQKVALMINFSEERIMHIKNVIKIVMSSNVTQKTEMVSNQPSISEYHKNRTGRVIDSERKVDYQDINSEHNINSQYESHKTKLTSRVHPNTDQSKMGRTGKRVVGETPSEIRYSKKRGKTKDGIDTIMIVGGTMIAAAGLIKSYSTSIVKSNVAKPSAIEIGVAVIGILIAGKGIVRMKDKIRR